MSFDKWVMTFGSVKKQRVYCGEASNYRQFQCSNSINKPEWEQEIFSLVVLGIHSRFTAALSELLAAKLCLGR